MFAWFHFHLELSYGYLLRFEEFYSSCSSAEAVQTSLEDYTKSTW